MNKIVRATESMNRRVFLAVGVTGNVRVEWMFSRYGQTIPCNWSQAEYLMWMQTYAPMGFLVAEARNMAVQQFMKEGHEYLFFIDHDTCLPLDFFLKANDRMLKEKLPAWSGLYFTKSVPSEPLVYRGRGVGYYAGWKMGDKVWTDSLPMGCTVIHRSLIEVMYKDAEQYKVGNDIMRRVFITPQRAYIDPVTNMWQTQTGTEDLNWSWRVIEKGYLAKAGWPKFQKKKYPFLVDTSLFCRHVDPDGKLYPSMGEEKFFERRK